MTDKKPMGNGKKLALGCGIGCGSLVALFVLLAIIGAFLGGGKDDSSNAVSTATVAASEDVASAGLYKVGETFDVGYTSYKVLGKEWRHRLGDSYIGQDANARFLLVRVLVKNNDKKNRMIPPFHLQDDVGNTYDEESGAKLYLGNDGVLLDSLNPGVSKKAILVFDVPPGNNYSLKVSGGFWSSDNAVVDLSGK